MLSKYGPNANNYNEAQNRIAKAMKKGYNYVYLPGKSNADDFDWVATEETIEKLRNDGFYIDEMWEPLEYWSVEW